MKRDPYTDLGEVFAEETSLARIRVQPTPRTPVDPDGSDNDAKFEAPGVRLYDGFHIDGDPRYQER